MKDWWSWGIVTQAEPGLVVLDGPSATPVIVSSTLVPLVVGARVLVHITHGAVIVHGVNRGGASWRVAHAAPTSGGWRTLATFPGNGRASGTFRVFTDDSGDHDMLTVAVDVAYSSAAINVMAYNTFGRTSPVITGVRYLTSSVDPTYGSGLLQLRFGETPSGTWSVTVDQPDDELLKAWAPGDLGTSTSGFNTTTPTAQCGVYITDPVALSPINGWAAYGASFATPTVQMMPGGLIALDGLISGASATSGVLAVLPEGARPRLQGLFSAHVRANSATSPARLDILPSGNITLSDPGYAATSWVSLSGVVFPAYQ